MLRAITLAITICCANALGAAAQATPADTVAVPGNIAAERQHADQLFDQGKLDEAQPVYARIAKSYAQDFEFNMRLAECYFTSKKKEMARAAFYFGKAHALKPKNVEAEMNYGKTLSWSKQYPAAIRVLRGIVERDPGNRAAWLELARAQNYGADPKGAETSYQTYLRRWPTDHTVRIEYATWLSWNKRYDESLEQYRLVLKEEPHNASVLAGEAQVFAWKNDLPRALETYDLALARAPRLYEALRGKAFTLLWLQKYDEAAKFFALAGKQKRPDPEVKQALASIEKWQATEPERKRQAELNVFLVPAEAAMSRKDYPAAIEQFQKALVVVPEDREIRFRLGEAYLWDRHWSDAMAVFGKLHSEKPEDGNVVRELGHAYTGAKQFEEAATLYRDYLQRPAHDESMRVELARVLSWSGKLDPAVAEYREVLRQKPDDFEAALGLAQVTAWQGHSAQALAEFQKLLERRPDSREAQLGRAQVLSWSGRSAEAIPLLEAMLQANPDDREIASVLQSVRDSLRQQEEQQKLAASGGESLEKRIERDEATLKLHPDDAKLLERLGDGYAELKKYKQGIADYEKALALEPANTEVMLRLARVASWNRDFARSIEVYNQLLAHDDKPEYRLELARVLSWAGRTGDSIAQYRLLLQHSPDDTEVRLGLARVLSWDKQTEASLAEYDRVLQKDPNNRTALFERARAHAWQGDYRAALTQYDTLLKSAPNDSEILLAKAQVLNWSGQPREARKIIEGITKEYPKDTDITLANAAVQSSLGRRDVALRLLDDLDKLQPGNHDVESLRQSILEDMRPMLILGFTPSFDSGQTAIYASTAAFYFSPKPQIRSYFRTNLIPSFVPTTYHSETGREFLFGSYGRVNSRLQLRGEIGANAATAGNVSPIGGVGATVFATDKMQFDFDFSRQFINYLPKPITLNISRIQYRGAWNWRPAPRTTVHVDYYHEDYSDSNRNDGANVSLLQRVMHREHFELETGYLFAISGFDHQGKSGFFTPTSFQRHAGLGNARIIISPRTGISFWGSLGGEEVFHQAYRLDGTARASWDYKLTPNLRMSTGYGYFAVSSVGGSSAYITHTAYATLQYVF